MGATGSAQKKKGIRLPDGIYVEKLKVAIDKRPTTMDERSQSVLKYRTPHFRATGHVRIPDLQKNEGMRIGWIQACTEMSFMNTYGSEGVSSWEFPEVNSGKYPMISDSDGRDYPWYGSKQEFCKITGPASSRTVIVQMNDNFFPQVTWHVPDGRSDKTPKLTMIERDQAFYAWLVIQNLADQSFHVLKTTRWSMRINIRVDPTKPLGQRAQLVGPYEQDEPQVLNANVPIPTCALRAPNANNSQVLIWRPARGKPVMVVPPIETTMSMQKYLAASTSSTHHAVISKSKTSKH